ncbi:DinB family protein [Nocardioides sp. CPCC 206347]|uniref:DinB family protein n=1 Tax=Nocardioides sp. CPCC 206347 TaxID=3406463 RepID=UPI003B438435
MTTAPLPPPDTKDWTWVLDQPCAECGFVAADVGRSTMGATVRENAAHWAQALADPRARQRPEPTVWSPTEYACHVRDVHRVFAGRLEQMLTDDDPVFANWDQDETAVADRYDLQDPADVVPDLVAGAEAIAVLYDSVPSDAWERPGRRSNGSVFTVDTLGRYHLHDVIHHRWDVRWLDQR